MKNIHIHIHVRFRFSSKKYVYLEQQMYIIRYNRNIKRLISVFLIVDHENPVRTQFKIDRAQVSFVMPLSEFASATFGCACKRQNYSTINYITSV